MYSPTEQLHIAEVALVMALFLKMHGQWRRKNTCVYCGEVAGHKQDCPYDYHNREDPPKG